MHKVFSRPYTAHNLIHHVARHIMSELFTVIDDSPLSLKKETTQLKRLLKTSNMSLESLRISNQSVRERCRQLEANLEKEKARTASLNKKLHTAAAMRCELDENAARSEYQIDKLSQKNLQLHKQITALSERNEEQAKAIKSHEEQAEIWETAFEQHKAQKLELIEQIVNLERKLQSKENNAKRRQTIKNTVNSAIAKVKAKIQERVAPLLQSELIQQKLKVVSVLAKEKLKTTKQELSLKHASKKLEMSKVKRKKYWERSQIS